MRETTTLETLLNALCLVFLVSVSLACLSFACHELLWFGLEIARLRKYGY